MCGWHTKCGRLLCDGLLMTDFHLRPGKEKCGGVARKYLKSPGWWTISNLAHYHSLTPIMDTTRACYSGLSRKLVVALDIGTTFSGAAYSLLDPGEVPKIQSVTRRVFPLISG